MSRKTQVSFTHLFSSLKAEFTPWSILAISFLAALLLSIHLPPCEILGALTLILLLWLIPTHANHYLLLTLPVIFAATPSVPQGLTPSLIISSLYILLILSRFILRNQVCQNICDSFRRPHWRIFIAVILLFVAANFYIAVFESHVSVVSWLRGITPFSLLCLIPIFSTAYKLHPELIYYQPFYLAGAGLIHVSTVLEAYCSNSLWKDLRWRYIESTTSWKRLPDTYPLSPDALLTKLRVSILEPNSTSFLIIISGIIAVYLIYQSSRKRSLTVGALLLSIVIFTILASYTRSMLAVSLIGILFIATISLFTLQNGLFVRRSLLTATIVIVMTLVSINVQGTGQIIKNRVYVTQSSFQRPSSRPENQNNTLAQKRGLLPTNSKDPNIASRLYETEAALRIYQSSPLFGAGFGVQYTIPREVNLGRTIYKPTAYTHNLLTYMLMTSGWVGLLLALSLYAFMFHRYIRMYRFLPALSNIATIQITITMAMLIYSMFFAVFRLPIYNFSLALLAGLAFTPYSHLVHSVTEDV